MQYGYSVIERVDITYIEELLFDEEGRLKAVSNDILREIPHPHLRYFCHVHGLYSIPSLELMDALELLIGPKEKALEIGAGNGVYGRHLGIKSTDNYMQHDKNKAKYKSALDMINIAGVIPVQYGYDVEEYDAIEAVRKFKPSTVIGAWVTHKYNPREHERGGNMYGVDMHQMLDRKSVERFILIGNKDVHASNPLMDLPHKEIMMVGIYSRASNEQANRIFIWD